MLENVGNSSVLMLSEVLSRFVIASGMRLLLIAWDEESCRCFDVIRSFGVQRESVVSQRSYTRLQFENSNVQNEGRAG